MNAKLLGTAVGAVLDNKEALRNVGAPIANASQGIAQVIWRTIWKSTVVGVAMLIVWMFMFATTYILGGTYAMVNQSFISLFGMFLFFVLPIIIFTRESRKVSKAVKAKNKAQREAADLERVTREAQYEEARILWEAQQQQQQQPMMPRPEMV